MKNLRIRLIVNYFENRMTIKDSYYDLIELSKCFGDKDKVQQLKIERKKSLKEYKKLYKEDYKRLVKERR